VAWRASTGAWRIAVGGSWPRNVGPSHGVRSINSPIPPGSIPKRDCGATTPASRRCARTTTDHLAATQTVAASHRSHIVNEQVGGPRRAGTRWLLLRPQCADHRLLAITTHPLMSRDRDELFAL